MKLADVQQAFLDSLRNKNQNLANLIIDQGKIDFETRLGIYRNAYNVTCQEVLSNDHEQLHYYLGDVAFNELSADYLVHHPSTTPSLRHFGRFLPGFLSTQEQYAALPELAELAHFERTLLDAFDAADAPRITLDDIRSLAPEQWPIIQVEFHPSIRLLSYKHNTVEIWQHLKQEKAPPAAEKLNALWLVYRNVERLTEFRSISEDEHVALSMAKESRMFSDICEALLTWHEPEQVAMRAAQLIQSWIHAGLLSGIKAEENNDLA